MPTGYTAKLYDGEDISFSDFAFECSRAFGVMAHLRDDPHAELPEKFEVNPRYITDIEKARERVQGWKDASDADLHSLAVVERSAQLLEHYRSMSKKVAILNRYTRMLNEVKAWVPPSDEHVNFKKFMIEQLESSIQADCRGAEGVDLEVMRAETDEHIRNLRVDVDDYRARELAHAERDLKYRIDLLEQEETKNIAPKNKWIKELRDSLNAPSVG